MPRVPTVEEIETADDGSGFAPIPDDEGMPRHTRNTKFETLPERKSDKLWLLEDLHNRRCEALSRLERKTGFMHQVTLEGIARFERLILMVEEIPE